MVRYTDADYNVFFRAAKLLSKGASPYNESTFRYSPVLAHVLLGDRELFPGFGKAVFVAGDLVAALLLQALLQREFARPRSAADKGLEGVQRRERQVAGHLALWLLNPLVFNMSTRGSADVLVCVLVLATLWLLAREQRLLAGVALGLGAHLRLYPVIYLPTLLLFLPSLRARAALLAGAAAGFAAPTALFFAEHGWAFIDSAYLFHLRRRDVRHNFSPLWLWLYLSDAAAPLGAAEPLLCFAPQAATQLAIAWALARRQPSAQALAAPLLLQTICFVALNKVLTAQYFLWAFALVPLALPVLRVSGRELALWACAWAAAEAHWLLWAYRLEFEGRAVFRALFAAALLLLAVHVGLVLRVLAAAAPAASASPAPAPAKSKAE